MTTKLVTTIVAPRTFRGWIVRTGNIAPDSDEAWVIVAAPSGGFSEPSWVVERLLI